MTNAARYLSLVLLLLITAMLACSTSSGQLRIDGAPQYVCPSATPRPTDTALPPDPPTYPPYFAANLARPYFQGTGPITLQLRMQQAGTVYLAYHGYQSTAPYVWPGTNGQYLPIAFSPQQPNQLTWQVYVPPTVSAVTLTLYAERVPGRIYLYAYRAPYTTPPQPPPCCPPPVIQPTARPTYTPYPSPTPYVRANDYFVGDIIYTDPQPSGLQLGLRVLGIESLPADTPDAGGNPQSLQVWTFEVSNVGQVPYTVFPPAQSYVSILRQAGGGELAGVWGPSLAAAEEAGLDFTTSTWDPQEIPPGVTRRFSLAAYTPLGTAHKISYVLDSSRRTGRDNPTVVPGTNIVAWLNQTNTVCTGDIAPPR